MTEPPIPPEPPQPEEMTLRPPGEFRREQYDTDAALELFENLLLAAARIPVEAYPATHPLVLEQAAKALVGLRPHEPSRRLIDFALDRCPELPPERPVDDLKIPLERLGTTVAVFELEAAVEAGDQAAAREQLGRLLLVSDNKPFAFDILLDLAARQPDQAPALVPLVHYCLRAAQFVGHGHVADFLLPALDALVAASGSSRGSGSRQLAVGSSSRSGKPGSKSIGREFGSVWEVLPYLGEAPLEALTLAAHGAQIAADEHVKQGSIQRGILKTLSNNWQLAVGSSSGSSRGGGRGSTGDRGWLLEELEHERQVREAFEIAEVPCHRIGSTSVDKAVRVRFNGRVVVNEDVAVLRDLWEETSFRLDRLQANPDLVEQESVGLRTRTGPSFALSFAPAPTAAALLERDDKPRVVIIREEGSNGDREMTSAFYAAGFEPWDVVMSDLLNGRVDLRDFRGAVFVGGFSFADVLDSAKGWAGVIRFNKDLWRQFEEFYARPDTFSLGVCNGCQLMALLGWVPWRGIAEEMQPRFVQNASGRFESRFATVRIQKSAAIMLRDMEEATLGIWSAHGEGQAFFPSAKILEQVEKEGLAPVRFVDDDGEVTEQYPFNPNGSPSGIAALCSPDGRHLAMMPHPERTFLTWQWGWMPEEWKRNLTVSPWLKMFQNAREWCEGGNQDHGREK